MLFNLISSTRQYYRYLINSSILPLIICNQFVLCYNFMIYNMFFI